MTYTPQGMNSAKTIFFAEDDDDNGEIVQEMLQGLGYRVLRARHGGELLEYVKEKKPDLILLDIDMPVMDGIATFRALRQDAHLQHIPIVGMSGKVEPALPAMLESTGFTAFLGETLQ